MHLALAMHPVLPSARLDVVGIPEYLSLARQVIDFAAQYLTCTFPCQRFDAASRAAPHDSEPLRLAKPLTYETLIHNTLPVLTGARDFMPQEYIEIRDAPERLT